MKYLLALVLIGLAIGANAEGGVSGKPAASGSDGFGYGRGYGYGYGALAYDLKTRAWAYAVNYSDKAGAMAVVSKLCGPACATYGVFDQCGVVVANGTDIGYGTGPDKVAAEVDAQKRCVGEGCQVAVWGCNLESALEGVGFSTNANHPKNYGAITYDGASGAFGAAWDYGSFPAAVGAARNACGKDCLIYATQLGGCGVLAKGGDSVTVGSGADFKSAEEAALAKCSGGACSTVTWFCNSGSR